MILFSYSPPAMVGHGGNRRVLQLCEVLTQKNIKIDLIERPNFKKIPLNEHIQQVLSFLFRSNAHGLFLITRLFRFKILLRLKEFLAAIICYGYYFNKIDLLVKQGHTSLLFAADCGWHADVLVHVAKYFGLQLIALPENIPATIPNSKSFFSGKSGMSYLAENIDFLKRADVVIVMTEVDRLIYSALGVSNILVLPYYTPACMHERFKLLLQRRQRTQTNESYLMIGTFSNPATFKGAEEIIQVFKSSKRQITLNIAGFFSERLNSLELTSNIHILGEQSEEQLETLLAETKAVIIHQRFCGGALTKISELLLAGIPLIASRESIRGYEDSDGIMVFSSVDTLGTVIDEHVASGFHPNTKHNYVAMIDEFSAVIRA